MYVLRDDEVSLSHICCISLGHLDRVLHGINAEEVLYACDENIATSSTGDVGLANPAVHFFRGLRHRNLSAIRHATQVLNNDSTLK